MNKFKTWDDIEKEFEFTEEEDMEMELELALIRATVEARKNANLTQRDLLLNFEKEHCSDTMSSGKPLIKEEYVKRRIPLNTKRR